MFNFGIHSITKERFLQLAAELVSIFATSEKSGDKLARIFYYPFVKGTQTKKCVHQGGTLYDKYCYVRRKLIKYNLLSKKECLPQGVYLNNNKTYYSINIAKSLSLTLACL